MTEHPILFNGDTVKAILEGRKTMARRPVKKSNSLFDGGAWPKGIDLSEFDWDKAWVDSGPSPAGNSGPYLKLPWPDRGTVHRIYPKYQPGDILAIIEVISREPWCGDCRLYLPRKINTLSGCAGQCAKSRVWPIFNLTYTTGAAACPRFVLKAKSNKTCDDGEIVETRDTGERREVTAVGCEQIQEISWQNAIAEGIEVLEQPAGRIGKYRTHLTKPGCFYALATSAFGELWQSIYPGSWERNDWVWIYEFKMDLMPQDRTVGGQA